MEIFDVIVVGLGAMGASTTYHLAKRNVRVLGLDQHEPTHKLGSSHGETRMTRAACGEGEIYTDLVQRSHRMWREIESETARMGVPMSLLTLNGYLLIGSGGGHGVKSFLEATAELATSAGVPFERLVAADLQARFTAIAAGNDEAYLDYKSGYLQPEACIKAQLMLAEKFGASVRGGEHVISFSEVDGGVEVTTSRGVYLAGSMVLAAGPWLPKLLPERSRSRFEVRRQVLYWFALRNEEDLPIYQAKRFPCFVWLFNDDDVVYGFPAMGTARDGIKVATEVKDVVTPESVKRTVSEEETRRFFETHIRDRLPGLSPECVRAEVCLYTMERETMKRFIVDRHPSMDKVICVSACSGHGFKHSPAIGEIVAGMALDGTKKAVLEFAW